MSTTSELDHIERETTIAAPASRVWRLVMEPGWWINDGAVTEHHIEPDGPDRVIVHDPAYGAFAVERVEERPEEYVAFRWYSGASATRRTGPLTADTATLVEFFVTAEGPETTRLRVAETGFAHLDEDARERRQMFEDNASGWVEELAAARRHVEGGRA